MASQLISKTQFCNLTITKLHHLTPLEEPVVAQFGPHVKALVTSTLANWMKALQLRLRRTHELKPIQAREHVNLIMNYLRLFRRRWEQCFGIMERSQIASRVGQATKGRVYIRSTG
ncbi:hypothetical protein VWW61_21920, partial [Xanthomonas citri pv. citri]